VSPDELPPILLDVPDPLLEQEAVHDAERRLEAEHEERVRHELAVEAAVLTDAGVEVTLHVRVGVPPDEIIRLATELGTGLIVIGSHGKRSLQELLLGSTVENVTKHSPCPVLVVR
jgi:nucleotide-binding universal stress UspA family protein